MRIDAHQHFWRFQPAEYDWIEPDMVVLRRDFLPDDLRLLLQEGGIDGTVAVQARQSLAETRWLLELAAEHRWIMGVVGWVPLADPTVSDQLDLLADQTALKGVRHVVQAEADPDFLHRADFNRGIAEVARRGLTYDLLIKAHQLPPSIAFADRHETLCLVLDHIGKPHIAGAPPPEWRAQIRELARREHVSCKFSGVVTEVAGGHWSPELLEPYFEVVVEAFGPRRVMFGSDWPVCRLRSDYATWLAFVSRCVARLSPDEQAAILGDNATRIYRLS